MYLAGMARLSSELWGPDMTTLTEQAGALAEEWKNTEGSYVAIGHRMADLLRQIAALGDGERLTEDAAEQAYWQFDARRKGLSEWRGMPMSERDAFKAEFRKAAAATLPLLARIEDLEARLAFKSGGDEVDAKLDIMADTLGRLTKKLESDIGHEEQLAACQAQYETLRGTVFNLNEARESGVGSRIEAALLRLQAAYERPSDLTALHADRKATIERVRDGAAFAPFALAIDTNRISATDALTQAAERAGRGEPI